MQDFVNSGSGSIPFSVEKILKKPHNSKVVIHVARAMPSHWWMHIYEKIWIISTHRPDIKIELTSNQKKGFDRWLDGIRK